MANEYLKKVNRTFEDPILIDLKIQAKKDLVPIVSDEGIRLILHLIEIGKYQRVLEIGTAIGYTTYAIAKYTKASIVTIEKNSELIKQAKDFISSEFSSDKVTFIDGDALEIDTSTLGFFDVIFIDAAKSQYIKFFEKYESLLNKNGIIITDNLLFHGFVENPKTIISRNRKQLVGKIDRFNQWLLLKQEYDSHIYEIGDGIAISFKK